MPPVKLYYRIGEVAELVGVEPHVLRYWESEFPTIRPQKSRSGQRVYSRRDVDKLLRVKDLLYAQRFTIAGARQRLRGAMLDVEQLIAQNDQVKTEVAPETAPETKPEAPPAAQRETVALHETVVSASNVSAAAMTLRRTLLTVREQVIGMLEAIEVGEEDALDQPE